MQLECNKSCFECNQRGITYVDVTIGTFVCSSCGGLLRGLSFPHRVKSISMCAFTPTEVALVEMRGNDYCRRIYLGRYDERCQGKPDPRNQEKLKYFLELKYVERRWYVSPEEAYRPLESFMKSAAKSNPKYKQTSSGISHKAGATSFKSAQASSICADQINKQQTSSAFSSSSNVLVPVTTKSVASSKQTNGSFANFDQAFASQKPDPYSCNLIDTGVDVSSSAATTGFGDFSNLLAPVSGTSNEEQQVQPQKKKLSEKYANLDKLFSMENDIEDESGAMPAQKNLLKISANSAFSAPNNSQLSQHVPVQWQPYAYAHQGIANPFSTANQGFAAIANAQFQQPNMFNTNQFAVRAAMLPNSRPVSMVPVTPLTQPSGISANKFLDTTTNSNPFVQPVSSFSQSKINGAYSSTTNQPAPKPISATFSSTNPFATYQAQYPTSTNVHPSNPFL